MALVQIAFFCVFMQSLSGATMNPILEHPQTVTVDEGMWANFTCAIRNTVYSIIWRIGEYTQQYHSLYTPGDQFRSLEGVTVRRNGLLVINNIFTETIGILATAEIDGTPVECMFVNPRNRKFISQFALLHVNLDTSSTSGNLDTSSNNGSLDTSSTNGSLNTSSTNGNLHTSSINGKY